MLSAAEPDAITCEYMPQGLLQAWSDDRYLWQDSLDYKPVIEGNAVVAIELTRLAQDHQLTALGFNVGDRLTSVNGVSVDDSNAFALEVSQLVSKDSILLEFQNRSALRLIQQADQC
jgi:type II secretory pathway component PulC